MEKLSNTMFNTLLKGDIIERDLRPYKFVNKAYGYINDTVLLYKEEHINYNIFYQCIGKDGEPIDSNLYVIHRGTLLKRFEIENSDVIRVKRKELEKIVTGLNQKLIEEEQEKTEYIPNLVLDIAIKMTKAQLQAEVKHLDTQAMIERSIYIAKLLIDKSYE